MIVFDLQCVGHGHRFEGWFGSSADYESQSARGLVSCPSCGSDDVVKAVMAPNVGRKGNQVALAPPPREDSGPKASGSAAQASGSAPRTVGKPPQAIANAPLPPEAVAMLKAVAMMQAEAIKSSTWVGDKFADDARAMHYGEKDAVAIHGRATPDEARDLLEEGIQVAPLLVPVAPPDETN